MVERRGVKAVEVNGRWVAARSPPHLRGGSKRSRLSPRVPAIVIGREGELAAVLKDKFERHRVTVGVGFHCGPDRVPVGRTEHREVGDATKICDDRPACVGPVNAALRVVCVDVVHICPQCVLQTGDGGGRRHAGWT